MSLKSISQDLQIKYFEAMSRIVQYQRSYEREAPKMQSRS